MRWVRAQWDRVSAWLLIVAGLVALLVGWWGVSHTAYLAEQMPYVVSAGLFGLFLLGLGATVWISADLRDEWRKLDELADVIRRTGTDADTATDGGGRDHESPDPVVPDQSPDQAPAAPRRRAAAGSRR